MNEDVCQICGTVGDSHSCCEKAVKEPQAWVTNVVQVDVNQIAFDVPEGLYHHLNLRDGDKLIWAANDDGTITIAKFKSA